MIQSKSNGSDVDNWMGEFRIAIFADVQYCIYADWLVGGSQKSPNIS